MPYPTVLIVDNNALVCELIQRTLQREGIHVIVQDDALNTLILLGEERPALVLLGVDRAGMDGYHLGQIIHKNLSFRHIPLLFLCTEDEDFNPFRGRQAGSTEFLKAPFDTLTLVQSVKKYLVTPDPA